MTVWLTGRVSDCLRVCLITRLIAWSLECLIGCIAAGLVDWLDAWFCGSLMKWVFGCVIERLNVIIGCLISWFLLLGVGVVDCLFDWIIDRCDVNLID